MGRGRCRGRYPNGLPLEVTRLGTWDGRKGRESRDGIWRGDRL